MNTLLEAIQRATEPGDEGNAKTLSILVVGVVSALCGFATAEAQRWYLKAGAAVLGVGMPVGFLLYGIKTEQSLVTLSGVLGLGVFTMGLLTGISEQRSE